MGQRTWHHGVTATGRLPSLLPVLQKVGQHRYNQFTHWNKISNRMQADELNIVYYFEKRPVYFCLRCKVCIFFMMKFILNITYKHFQYANIL